MRRHAALLVSSLLLFGLFSSANLLAQCTISGPSQLPPSGTAQYCVPTTSGAAYWWSVTGTLSIVSGQGTPCLTVSGGSGTIYITKDVNNTHCYTSKFVDEPELEPLDIDLTCSKQRERWLSWVAVTGGSGSVDIQWTYTGSGIMTHPDPDIAVVYWYNQDCGTANGNLSVVVTDLVTGEVKQAACRLFCL